MKRRTRVRSKKARRPRPRRPAPPPARGRRAPEVAEAGEVVEFAEQLQERPETSPRLTGGDVDAAWTMAHTAGDEAVGGSVATPDQDVVDELGEALGVEQEPDEEFRTSEEILRERDLDRWRLEREAETEGEDGTEAET